MLIFKTLASITIVSVAGLGGANLLASATEGYFDQFRDVARISCAASVAGYPKGYQAEAEQACLAKKMSELEAQQAPVNSLTNAYNFSSKE